MITLISITEWKTKRGRERELEERARAKTCDNLRIKVHEMEKKKQTHLHCVIRTNFPSIIIYFIVLWLLSISYIVTVMRNLQRLADKRIVDVWCLLCSCIYQLGFLLSRGMLRSGSKNEESSFFCVSVAACT